MPKKKAKKKKVVKQESQKSSDDSVNDRFKNAKSISSDMMFGRNDRENDWQTDKWRGANAIGSDAYFGRETERDTNERSQVADSVTDAVQAAGDWFKQMKESF